LDCLQEGDRRTFSRCHGPISRIHREGSKHVGVQFLVHGKRDPKEKTISALKRTAVALSALGAATGTVLTGAVTIIAPNAGTLVLCGTLLHMTMAAIAITAGASVSTAASATFKRTVVDPREPTEKVSASEASLTEEQAKELFDSLKDFQKTDRGKCATCNMGTDHEGCIYVWTCCRVTIEKKNVASNNGAPSVCDVLVKGCEEFCTKGSHWLYDEKKNRVPGCLNKCTDCLAVQDEPNFAHNGCGDYEHRLE
jgi:hypothetical protein